MDEPLHLVKSPLRAARLGSFGRSRGSSMRMLDEGYLVHSLLRELWQDLAPSPFVTRSQGRTVSVWGYGSTDAHQMVEHARLFGDPELVNVLDDVGGVASKPMPEFPAGRLVGFHVRTCPVVRLASSAAGHAKGAEVDAFLARCFSSEPDTEVAREAVYVDWLRQRLAQTEVIGAVAEHVAVASMARTRLVRRTQGEVRDAHMLERPDVRFEGTLRVVNSAAFTNWLRRGVGRHRAFGFGAVLLVPPGMSLSR